MADDGLNYLNLKEDEKTLIEEGSEQSLDLELGDSINIPPSKINSPRDYFSKQAALTRDRFAAFLVDTFLLIYLFTGINPFIQKFSQKIWFLKLQFISETTFNYIVFGLVLFFFYVLFESIFGTTPGKLLCRLRVINLDGNTPSLKKNIIRNFFRIIDYPLLFLIAIFSMESSSLNQRLGDRLSQTLVIKKTRKRLTPLDLKNFSPSTTLIRMIAFVIDSLCYLGFLWLILLILNPEKKLSFLILFNLIPFFVIFYFILFEFLVSSTPGKIILGRKTVLENGEPLDGTSAILRNVSKPFDLILGYPLLVLTPKKQRLGDLISGTMVIKKRERNGFIALATLLILLGTLFYLSTRNPHREKINLEIKTIGTRLWQNSFQLKLPSFLEGKIKTEQKTSLPETSNSPLKIIEFYFSAGASPSQIRSDAGFRQGDSIFTFFKLQGFQKTESGEIKLYEDISIKNPQGEVLLNRSEVVRLLQTVPKNSEVVLFANQIQLSPQTPVGSYRLILTIRDEVGNTKLVEEKRFLLQ